MKAFTAYQTNISGVSPSSLADSLICDAIGPVKNAVTPRSSSAQVTTLRSVESANSKTTGSGAEPGTLR